MAGTYTGHLSSIVSRVRNLFGDGVKSFTATMVINLDGKVIGGVRSTAMRNEEGAFKFNKGTAINIGTITRKPALTILKQDDKVKEHHKRFVHNVFGYSTVGYTALIIKNGDVFRYDGKKPTLDVMDSSIKVTELEDKTMHVNESKLVDCIRCDETKKVIVNKVKIIINGAKVKETYNRHMKRYRTMKSGDPNTNPNITQVLHSPSMY